jgi:tRNA C32,U32 (ribose-2'-O)-methylase TrmJ
MIDVLEKIKAILATNTSDLDQIERTLTDGYAQALSLEAERWRLERRLTEVAHGLERGDAEEQAHELRSLAARLHGNSGELETLRGVLADLRRHADGVRVANLS